MANLSKLSETRSFITEWKNEFKKRRSFDEFQKKMQVIYEEQLRNLRVAEQNQEIRHGWLAGVSGWITEYRECVNLLRKAASRW